MERGCSCDNPEYSEFVCKTYGHVFTGNLEIIDNDKLRNIMKFGAKFRIDSVWCWDKVMAGLSEDLYVNVLRLSKKFNISVNDFRPWIDKVLEVVHKRIKKLKSNSNLQSSNDWKSVLGASLNRLHDKYIICTVDKASNNYSVICKKFYVKVLLDELGFDYSSLQPVGNFTYSPVLDDSSHIIHSHIRYLKEKFNVNCKDDDKRLPNIFWVPKLHKNPYKFRFIAGARFCSTKPISVVINKGLEVVRNNFKTYCNAISRNSGYNFFWSINSSNEFLTRIRSLQVFSLQVFYFSTLYTNLNHVCIIEHLEALLELVFNNTNRRFLCIKYDKAFFSARKYNSYKCFDLDTFKLAIRYVINEVFVCFGGLVFRQIKGIPMGGNCSPLIADLFLAHCEFVYMSSLLKDKKFGLARLLSNTSRYIDDLCFINYKGFDNIKSKIYPSDLIAERSGNNDYCVTYLDVKLTISEGNVSTSVFHKVDDFKFPVVLLTFPQSLIPYKMGCRVFGGQILRYLRICSNREDFFLKSNKTASLLIGRGYKVSDLQFDMEKILANHSGLLLKFNLFSPRQVSNYLGFTSLNLH